MTAKVSAAGAKRSSRTSSRSFDGRMAVSSVVVSSEQLSQPSDLRRTLVGLWAGAFTPRAQGCPARHRAGSCEGAATLPLLRRIPRACRGVFSGRGGVVFEESTHDRRQLLQENRN